MIPEKDLMIKLLEVLYAKAKIYLFGSRARGTHKNIFDIELALDNEGKKIDALELMKAKNSLEATDISQKIDLVDFS